ncbi:MFS transporter [Planococcus lenghuensis]|uniref:Glucuronide permease n=1 Tax=Planococcus lenghuensis TaxID=2213202 RepID=A0A1Q2L2I7_9BACL|nr:MFS transporter [Planococcus lenghuensis]AQQ54623.1 glucuronide permease [Planococcus lenghuensis]
MTGTAAGNINEYHKAQVWRIGFFALNNTATNLYMFILAFVTYYATGVAGLTVVVVSMILTFMRVFDGITDPIIGFVIDKTESKFGKFRPLMVMGNIILAGSILVMYNFTHLLPESLQLVFFIAIYGIYIIGYTFQTACTKAAQTVLTNDPKQRPLFAVFDGVYNTLLFVGGQVFVASVLVAKHGGFTMPLFTELNTYAIVLGFIFTGLAVIGIWPKDRKEYFGLADLNVQTNFRDYWPILKGNRPLLMLIIAASSDKLTLSVLRHAVVVVMLFGILLGDYELSGTVSMIIIVPTLLITFAGVWYARKTDLKKSFVASTWIGLVSFGLLIALLFLVDPRTISLENLGFATIGFLILYALGMGFGGLPSALVIPMIADVSDYETYKSGRYVPGMIGTLFSFVDKLISSLAPALVGFAVALIGFRNEFPEIGEPLTAPLYGMTIFLAFGIPVLGWIASLIAMKFYHLNSERMEEIQRTIADVKEKAEREGVVITSPDQVERSKDALNPITSPK